MLNQYGQSVPEDLVVLAERPRLLSNEAIADIMKIDWYESRTNKIYILVSKAELEEIPEACNETTLEDTTIKPEDGFDAIDDVLKRCSYEDDSFYHA